MRIKNQLSLAAALVLGGCHASTGEQATAPETAAGALPTSGHPGVEPPTKPLVGKGRVGEAVTEDPLSLF